MYLIFYYFAFYFCILFILLFCGSLFCSLHFIWINFFNCDQHNHFLLQLKEFEDYNYFNQCFPDICRSMLYDMSFSQEFVYLPKLPGSFTQHLKYNSFLDIGSGSGGATIHHMTQLFEPNFVKSIILSDLYPKIEHWETLKNKNTHINYISHPVDATNIHDVLRSFSEKPNVSLLGSLHHLNVTSVKDLFKQIRRANTSLFIIEPKKYPYFMQILHILTLPIFGMIFYTFACIFGSGIMDFPYGLYRIGIVPFYMTFDHIIGASRRYSVCELEILASQYGLNVYHHSDYMFDYYIIGKSTVVE